MTDQAVEKVIQLFINDYNKYNEKNEHWTVNVNKYVKTEWSKLDTSVAYLEHNYSDEEAEEICEKSFTKILKILQISYEEYEKYECDVYWNLLDELLDYYLTQI